MGRNVYVLKRLEVELVDKSRLGMCVYVQCSYPFYSFSVRISILGLVNIFGFFGVHMFVSRDQGCIQCRPRNEAMNFLHL